MSERRLVVLLDGERIGDLSQGESGTLTFVYNDEYRWRRDATPLSLSMPLVVPEHGDEVVRPFLWGILPDNLDVLRRWGRDYHASDRNPFALLGAVGEDCAGAVQFVRPERVDAAREAHPVEWLDDEEIAAKIRQLRSDPATWHVSTTTGQFSLAGAQPKVALFNDGSRWGLPGGRTPTTHIVKPAIADLDDHDLNEHLCLATARALGFTAARSSIETFGTERAVVIERYDRAVLDGVWRRVHQEDMCQTVGLHPDQKYEAEGGPSVARIVGLLRSVMPSDTAQESVSAFADAVIFSWLTAGTDAHAKNYSILLSGSEVRLAPLYDLASALPYEPHVPKLKLAMRIGGEYRLEIIERRHWERLATEVGIEPARLIERIGALAAALPDALASALESEGVAELESDLPPRLASRTESWVRRCLRQLRI